MAVLVQHYKKTVVPALQKQFGYKNVHEVPRLEKVVLNVGLPAGSKDAKLAETAEQVLRRISGQQPVKTLAKKSISNFKIRKGMTVGLMVTLRGKRMEALVEKLIHITLPRVRDFRGLSPKALDGRGNLSIGFKEFIAFPEIRPDEVERLHGLEVVVVTTAKTREEGFTLLKLLGFPFKETN
ncbi:50S ribosomal protein L5 [Patescibacteria group bacterium]|nr:MAG: 50S ribosomal protein L5 [Patescibacteria group bacterium]